MQKYKIKWNCLTSDGFLDAKTVHISACKNSLQVTIFGSCSRFPNGCILLGNHNDVHFLHVIRCGMCKFCTYDLMVVVEKYTTTTIFLHMNNFNNCCISCSSCTAQICAFILFSVGIIIKILYYFAEYTPQICTFYARYS